MQKFLLAFFFSVCIFSASAQSNDPALNTRLSEYTQLSRELNFEKLMDYLYPKLFQMAPRELMVQAMKGSFENEETKISLDSMSITRVGAEFKHNGIAYREIDYFMSMDLRLLDTAQLANPEFLNLMKTSLGSIIPGGTVTFDKEKKSFHISGTDSMVAVKDKEAPWTFVGTKKDKTITEFLFPKEVIEKLGLF